MWPVASFSQCFPKKKFSENITSSIQTGSRSCQVSSGITGSKAATYAGSGLDCTGVPDISLPFFTQNAEEPNFYESLGEFFEMNRAPYLEGFSAGSFKNHAELLSEAAAVQHVSGSKCAQFPGRYLALHS